MCEKRPPWLVAAGRVIPVVTIDDAGHAEPLADALVRGGMHCAEITLRTPAGLAAVQRLHRRDDFTVGAGTVLNEDQAGAAIAAGAAFVVSPGFDDGVLAAGARAAVPVVAGIATASEAQRAVNANLALVKFFPAATSGGLPAVKALAAAFTQLTFMPTGGIRLEDLGTWFAEPTVVAVGGSWIVPRDLLAAGRYEEIELLARHTVDTLSDIAYANDPTHSEAGRQP